MCPHSSVLKQAMLKMLNGMLLASLIVSAGAQERSKPNLGQVFSPPYDAAHEITLVGTIQKIVTRHEAGSPVGTHLLVTGAVGTVDAHLGPFLTLDVQEALRAGTEVRIVGAMENLRGKQLLVAREVTFGGRTVILRTPRGLLVHAEPTRTAADGSQEVANTGSNGGSR